MYTIIHTGTQLQYEGEGEVEMTVVTPFTAAMALVSLLLLFLLFIGFITDSGECELTGSLCTLSV